MIRNYRGTISREIDKIMNPTKVYRGTDIPEEIRKKLEQRENKKKRTEDGESFKTPSLQSAE